ncbi:hypothetical protein PR048_028523 [Dryococelus australis]|uniref:DDE-1 domain-containing protein n=1 Tax=Dryococelus australis TaxID=614101 RepID=A0ABQ9GDF6_9NEOP|nr:hypothetical protein PR048_028523 [Dryococelus australis]
MKETRARETVRDQGYGIHRNTLTFKLHESESPSPPRKTGGQTAISPEEEKVIVSHVIALASYGFPVTTFELQLLIKSYLSILDWRVNRLNNIPRKNWAILFLNKHKKELSQRMLQNISRSRAALDRNPVSEFFENISKEREGIPSENIWNYDESNLQDDLGSKKIILNRGAKYPKIIRNATKVSVSIMKCGNTVGTLAPVYATYKADGLYQCWMEGGPTGIRYNRSKRDNICSHFNCRVLALCWDNDIKFVALPPHSAHLLQPLDMAFFRHMKGAWRSLLTNSKETDEGRRITTVPKTIFPHLLNDLMQELAERQITNLKAGFKACGVSPLNKNEVLKKFCNSVFVSSRDHIKMYLKHFLLNYMLKEMKQGRRNKLKRRKHQEIPSSSNEEEMEIVYAESDYSLGSLLNYNESDTGNSDKNHDPPCDVLSNDPTDGIRFNEEQITTTSQHSSKNTPSPSVPTASEFKQAENVEHFDGQYLACGGCGASRCRK